MTAANTLSPSHRRLLDRHRIKMIRLTRLARRIGTDEPPCFVVAELVGDFAAACQDAGAEFLDGDGWVISIDATGLVEIVEAVFPDGLEPILTRAAGTVAVLVVTSDDVPEVAILGAEQLALEPGRA